MSRSRDKKVLVKEFHLRMETLVLTVVGTVVAAVAFVLGVPFSWIFVGAGLFYLGFVMTKRESYRFMKKEILGQFDKAIEAREKKFQTDGRPIILNNVVIKEIYCDIQGPRNEGSFVVVCTMEEPTGKEILYVYRHKTIDGRETSAEELITMEEEALGAFTTLLIDQGLDAMQIMDQIEYRVKDKIESRKAARGAKKKDDDDNGGTESEE